MSTHGGNLQQAKQKYGREEFLDFSANINPLGPPPGVFQAIQANLANIIHYPDPEGSALRIALSQKLQFPAEGIVLGNGAVELIYLLAQTLSASKVLIPVPTFAEYGRALSAVGANIEYFYLPAASGFQLQLEELPLDGCELLFICNPNNPTGQLLTEEQFVRLLEVVQKRNVFMVVDESFMDFVDPAQQWHASKYLATYDRLFVLYSLTKFYAIPGLRVGCGLASPQVINMLEKFRNPWNINSLALAAAEAALLDDEYAELTLKTITTERNYLVAHLNELNSLQPLPGNANFLLVKNSSELNGNALGEKLAVRGILIRDCTNFPGLGPEYFRIAVKDHAANEQLLSQLKQLLD